jgi:DNA (cytosine-5)-methyltransferase 1
MTRKRIYCADLFCGAGGTSTGLADTCEKLGLGLRLIAINHWEIAISTHSANHPEANHLCTALDSINPRDVVPGGRLDLLVASPECTHFSNARGGKPVEDQKRSPAWLILRWLGALQVDNVLIENVPEFEGWGPLIEKRRLNLKCGQPGENKYIYEWRPDPKRKGQIYLSFIEAIRAHGYSVEWKVLNCADFGDPTSRQRLFIIARRGRRKIAWPERTHAPLALIKGSDGAQQQLFEAPAILKPHRTAREIIDPTIEAESIFTRKRPLSPNTMRRIFAGLKKYCGLPFVVPQFGEREGQQPRTHAIDDPLPAVTSHGAGALVEPYLVTTGGRETAPASVDSPLRTLLTREHNGLVQSYIVKFNGGQDAQPLDAPLSAMQTQNHHGFCEPFVVTLRNHADANSVDEPLRALCASGQHHALCEAFVLGQQSGGAPRTVDDALPTIAADGAISLVQAESFLIPQHNDRTRSLDRPLQTLTTESRGVGLVRPFIAALNHGHQAHRHHSVDKPFPSVTSVDAWALVEPFIMRYQGNHRGRKDGDTRNHELDAPLPALDGSNRYGVVQPFLIKYYGTGEARSLDEPLDSLTTKDRFALVIPEWGVALDIRFRMLAPHELAAAHSFPKHYQFKGTREKVVKQIGNSVPVKTSEALCTAILS